MRNKLFYWFLTVVLAVSGTIMSACSNDDDEYFDKSKILGTWSQISTDTEGSTSITLEISYTFQSNGKASQRVRATMSYEGFIKDYVVEDITNHYSYVYNRNSTIEFTNVKGDKWTYNVYVNGNKMRLGNDEDGYFELTRRY